MKPTPLDAILASHDGVLLDAYGVLVDAVGTLAPGIALLEAVEARGLPYVVVTNDASKLESTTAARFTSLGLTIPAERIVTSGALLEAHFAAEGLAGRPCLVLGPPDSHAYVRRAGGVIVGIDHDPSEVEVLVIGDESGFDFLDGADAALTLAFHRVERGLPLAMILPNPDVAFPKAPGRYGFAAGGLAAMIEAALVARHGPGAPAFVRLGKPNRAIFDEARRRLGARAPVMFGDQMATDIRGANTAGVASALVSWGLTRHPPDGEERPLYWVEP